MLDIYVVGMSHTQAIKDALDTYSGGLKIEVDNLNADKNGSWYLPGRHLNPEYFDKKLNAKIVAAMFFGNWYNSIGLIEHPEPFDFAFPDFDTEVDRSRRLIPFTQLYRKFNNNIRHQMVPLYDLRKLRSGRIVLINTPPPIADEEHIRRYPKSFRDSLHLGIAPARLRRKLWKLQCLIFAELCAEKDVQFIEFPSETVTNDGYLKPEYCHTDPGHANVNGGASVIRQLEEIYHA